LPLGCSVGKTPAHDRRIAGASGAPAPLAPVEPSNAAGPVTGRSAHRCGPRSMVRPSHLLRPSSTRRAPARPPTSWPPCLSGSRRRHPWPGASQPTSHASSLAAQARSVAGDQGVRSSADGPSRHRTCALARVWSTRHAARLSVTMVDWLLGEGRPHCGRRQATRGPARVLRRLNFRSTTSHGVDCPRWGPKEVAVASASATPSSTPPLSNTRTSCTTRREPADRPSQKRNRRAR
jgi:hypothetical protein